MILSQNTIRVQEHNSNNFHNMYNLVASYVVHLYYLHPSIQMMNTKHHHVPQRMFQVKKYYNNSNNHAIVSVNNIILTEYSFPPLPSNYEVVNDNLEFFLHNYICKNNKLLQIEFKNYDESQKFEQTSCYIIIVSNMITGQQHYVVPQRYGENINEFIIENLNLIADLPQENIITVKQFLQGFNDISEINVFKLITPENIVEKIIEFYHNNEHIEKPYVVDILQTMLQSSEYKLSQDFKNTKVNLQEVQLKFDTQTKQISRNEILAEVFNIDNNVSLL